jgi:hypothetical protein
MASAEEVSTKMKLMFKHMEQRALEIAGDGCNCTVGTFTPTARFKKDHRVPEETRYTIQDTVVELSFNPTQQEAEAYKEWKARMKTQELNSQKSVASDNTGA